MKNYIENPVKTPSQHIEAAIVDSIREGGEVHRIDAHGAEVFGMLAEALDGVSFDTRDRGNVIEAVGTRGGKTWRVNLVLRVAS